MTPWDQAEAGTWYEPGARLRLVRVPPETALSTVEHEPERKDRYHGSPDLIGGPEPA